MTLAHDRTPSQRMISAGVSLRMVKLVHTLVWAIFAGSIVLIPPLALLGRERLAGALVLLVLIEVLVLAVNGGRCPLTGVAARFTTDRRDNFDIYLPEWLARHNKLIFGSIYLFGVAATLLRSVP